jgi:hypothetical protein
MDWCEEWTGVKNGLYGEWTGTENGLVRFSEGLCLEILFWGPFLGSFSGVLFWGPFLGSFSGVLFWGPFLGPMARARNNDSSRTPSYHPLFSNIYSSTNTALNRLKNGFYTQNRQANVPKA